MLPRQGGVPMAYRILVPLSLLLLCAQGPVAAIETIPTEVPAYTADGCTMVPFRALLEWMGAQVSWDEGSQRVDARRGDTAVVLWVGKKEAQVNGHPHGMDIAPVLKADHVFIPLRFVAESLGAAVEWDAANWTVTVRDNGRVGQLSVSRTAPESASSGGSTGGSGTQASAGGDTIVYITNSGTKYHCAGCRSLRRSSIPISLAEAKRRGYTPCKICNPPQ
jgi:hypothetical protein